MHVGVTGRYAITLTDHDEICPKENSMGGPFPDLEGTGASMLAVGLRRSISLHAVSHRMSASKRSGRERPKRNRLRGFALESWSYNYDVTRTRPKSMRTVCEDCNLR
jgi:hypothetical protein